MDAAQKLVLGTNGLPTQVQADIDAIFPLTGPNWDFNTAEGKERLSPVPDSEGGPPRVCQMALKFI